MVVEELVRPARPGTSATELVEDVLASSKEKSKSCFASIIFRKLSVP